MPQPQRQRAREPPAVPPQPAVAAGCPSSSPNSPALRTAAHTSACKNDASAGVPQKAGRNYRTDPSSQSPSSATATPAPRDPPGSRRTTCGGRFAFVEGSWARDAPSWGQVQRLEGNANRLRRQSRPSQPDQPLHQRLKPAQPLLHSPAPGVVVGCRVTVAGGLLCGLLASFSSGQGLLQAGLARAGAHVSLTPSSVPTSSRAAAMPSAASPDRAQQAAESARSLGVDAEHGDEVIGVLEARE